MSDIFISYAREDEPRIRDLVKALEDRGWSIFWDRRIPAGQTWRNYIGKELKEAKCVIVAWSRNSLASQFVTEEADEGKQRGILVPILLDSVTPPLGFRSIHAADLCDWEFKRPSPKFEQLANDIISVLTKLEDAPKIEAGLGHNWCGGQKSPLIRRSNRMAAYVMVATVLIIGMVIWIFKTTRYQSHLVHTNDNEKMELYDKMLYNRLKNNRKPSFLVYDFFTYGENRDLGSIYSNTFMHLMFKSNYANKIIIVERLNIEKYLEEQNLISKSPNEYFRGLQEVGAKIGVTHVLQGRLIEDSKLLSVHLFSCLSKRIILVDRVELKDLNDLSINSQLLIKTVDSVIETAIEEISTILMERN